MIERLPFSLFIGIKYLRSRRRQKWISLISIFSIMGILLGVMALIVVLSVMGGFDQDLKKRILGVYSPITIGGQSAIENYQAMMESIQSIPEVEAVSPFVSGQILAKIKSRAYGVYLRAIVPDLEEKTTQIRSFIKKGTLKLGARGIVVGNELAKNFRIKLGDSIELLSPVSIPTPLGMSAHSKKMTVVGIFDSGMYEYDLNLAYVSLKTGQELYALGHSVTGLTVQINDLDRAFEIKEAIQDVIPQRVPIKTWLEANKNLFRAIVTEKWMMFWILLLIVLVAAFNISSSLIMMVMEKRKDIGILVALGATRGLILRIFLLQGLLIGIVGTGLGFLGGVFLTANLNPIANTVRQFTGFEFFPKDVYYLDKIPALLDWGQSLLVAFSALLLSLLAALLPAYQATRLKPVEVIRYE